MILWRTIPHQESNIINYTLHNDLKKVFKKVQRMVQKSRKHGSKSGVVNSPLTPTEQVILSLISNEYLTPKQIARRQNISLSRVYRIIKNIKKKGHLNSVQKGVQKNEPGFQPLKHNLIRLHGQEFNIKLLFKDKKYTNSVGKLITLDGNTIRCYRDSIEVYSGHSFYADDVQKATVKSLEYFTKLFYRLENDLNIIIMKPRSQNIILVNQHYAEINNELAEESEQKGYKIRIYSNENGKLWFVIDNSFNLHEAETQGITAKEDMQEIVRPFFNDLRDNKPPLPSEVYSILSETVRQNKETAIGLNLLVKVMSSKIPDQPERPDYFG